jgi:hypothetical protein
MATYVNDLRLKEIATGDEAGTWGTSTNTNLELIGEALGYGTQDCFASDADATTTVADGASDPARAMYFKVTSSATLSSGDLTLDVAGEIHLDSDSGIIRVRDAGGDFGMFQISSNDFIVRSMFSDADLLFKGNDGGSVITALTLDMSEAGAATFNSTIAATSADLRNTSSGAETTALSLRNFAAGANTATALNFYPTQSTTRFASIVAENIDGNNNITLSFLTSSGDTPSAALTLNQDRTATFSGAITANAGVVVDNFTLDGTTLALSSGSMTLDSASQIILDAAGGNFQFLKSGTEFARFFESGSDFYIYNPISDKDIKFYGNDGGVEITALTLDMSAAGAATFSSTIALGDSKQIFFGADSDGRISFDGTDTLNITASNGSATTVNVTANNFKIGGANRLISGTANDSVVINEDSADVDFRVESNDNANMLFVDGGNNRVGIGKAAASQPFEVGVYAQFDTGMTINESGADSDFRVESDSNANMLFVDASVDRVGVGATPMTNGSTFQVTSDSTESTNMQLTLRGASDTNKQMIMGFDTTANTAHITTQIAGSAPTPLIFKTGNVVFNEAGSDFDFRVESDAFSSALAVEGSSGKVNVADHFGIGKTSSGEVQSSGSGFFFVPGGTGYYSHISTVDTLNYSSYFNRKGQLGGFFNFAVDDVGVGSVTYNGSVTVYSTSSDERLKENIADADDAGSKIDAMKVRKFDWKRNGRHQEYGMVAQELLPISPDSISQGETEEDMMSVDYSTLVPMLIKEIQSLRARVADLES